MINHNMTLNFGFNLQLLKSFLNFQASEKPLDLLARPLMPSGRSLKSPLLPLELLLPRRPLKLLRGLSNSYEASHASWRPLEPLSTSWFDVA